MEKIQVGGTLTRKSNLSRKSMQGKDQHNSRSQNGPTEDDSTHVKSQSDLKVFLNIKNEVREKLADMEQRFIS